MPNSDAEFAEFLAAAWPSVYRTTYAVAGRHSLTRDAVQGAFSRAYDDRDRVLDSDEPESGVRIDAIQTVLNAFKSAPERASTAAEFGPLIPDGTLISASPEERSSVHTLWTELQTLDPEDRGVIALAAGRALAGQSLDADPQADVRLVDFLVTNLGEVVIHGADLNAVIAQGTARQHRRRWVAGAVAVVLVGVAAIPVALFAAQQEAVSAKQTGVWREVASAPLTPRLSTLATWTGTEALFWGGRVPQCIGYGSCGPGTRWQSEGVAFDPADQTWRRLPDAPFAADGGVPHIQVGDEFLVEDEDLRWWAFGSASSRWTPLADPPAALVSTSVTSRGSLMYAVGSGLGDQVQVYDTNTDDWSTLPPSQGTPRLADRVLVATPVGLLAVGRSFGESPDGRTPIYRVEFFDGNSWTRLGAQIPWATQCCWHWTGDRLLVPQVAAGLVPSLQEVGIPVLEVPTPSPTSPTSRTWSQEIRSGPMLAWSGNLYDDRDRSIGRLERPVGAPDDIAAAVWADRELIVLGGQNPLARNRLSSSPTSRVWVYTAGD